jgi:hypothetical protein
MIFLHPSLNCNPAACAKLELAIGLRADIFETKSGSTVVVLVDPKSVTPHLHLPKPKPIARPTFDQGPFGGNAA